MLKKIFSLLLSFTLILSVALSVSAKEPITNKIEVINVSCPEFDINDHQQYKSLISQYGISEENILDIYEFRTDNSGQRNVGGVLVLAGEYLSSHNWRMVLLNIGVHTVTSFETDVKCYNNTYGPVVISTERWGALAPGVSTSRVYSSAMWEIDCSVATVTGKISTGEWFSMGGSHYR